MLAHDERKVVVMNPIIYQDFTLLSLSTNSRLSIVSETPTDTDEHNDPAEQTK